MKKKYTEQNYISDKEFLDAAREYSGLDNLLDRNNNNGGVHNARVQLLMKKMSGLKQGSTGYISLNNLLEGFTIKNGEKVYISRIINPIEKARVKSAFIGEYNRAKKNVEAYESGSGTADSFFNQLYPLFSELRKKNSEYKEAVEMPLFKNPWEVQEAIDGIDARINMLVEGMSPEIKSIVSGKLAYYPEADNYFSKP